MDTKWLFQQQRQNMGVLKLLELELYELDHQFARCSSMNGSSPLSISENRFFLLQKIDDCRYLQSLYESVFLILNDSERWIVETHFIEGKTIAETLTLIPANIFITSRSSLIRRINRLLMKSDAFIANYVGNHRMGDEETCKSQGRPFSMKSLKATTFPY